MFEIILKAIYFNKTLLAPADNGEAYYSMAG